jgi:DNA-binding HxlR family transcriptional regulator
MQDQTQQIRSDEHKVERAIVLQILRDDHDENWSRAELEIALGDTEQLTISDALARLEEEGVIELSGEIVLATRATRHLDALELLAI